MNNVFSYNADIEKNAYLNWRTSKHDHIHNMIVLADGFMSAATLLAKQVLLDNVDKKADLLIFPILFNANHGIEVYLKAISWSLNILNNTGKRFDPHHKLNKLLEKNISLVNTFENDSEKLKTFNSMIDPLEKYLNELSSKIESVTDKGKEVYKIDFSRYTLDVKNEPQFYINEFRNVVVDIENFIVVFESIHTSLNNIANHYLYYNEEN
ncbi:hypothetical protein ACFWMS_23705 [Peribacillus butanolivorans]|uniref:hypothetical protein n=1 Tax=Peribacillus butanolivorans TaxID=421767 RepID=UPI00365283BB